MRYLLALVFVFSLFGSVAQAAGQAAAQVADQTADQVADQTAAQVADQTADQEMAYGRVDIGRIGFESLEALKADPRISWWVEVDDQLLVLAERSMIDSPTIENKIESLGIDPEPQHLAFLRRAHVGHLDSKHFDVLALGGRFAVVQGRNGPPVLEEHDGHRHHPKIAAARLPFEPNTVLARQEANRRPSLQTRADRYGLDILDGAASLVDEVDPARWLADVEILSGFNRYTHNVELLQARDWLVQTFDAMPGLTVTTQPFQVGGTTAYNVIATLEGAARPNEWHIIGAHYDSISQNTALAAPGAEDNASGCAGVVEMARVFSAHPPDETVYFICFSGEELGLIGSELHASGLVSAGNDDKIETVLNMDMIGYTGDADLDCLLETEPQFASLLTPFSDAAAEFTNLRIVTSLFAFGSDHVPYLNRDMPALLTIENDWNTYPGYHRTNDLPSGLSLAMGAEILKMNVGAMALRIGASSRPTGPNEIFTDGFEGGNFSAWTLTDPPQ